MDNIRDDFILLDNGIVTFHFLLNIHEALHKSILLIYTFKVKVELFIPSFHLSKAKSVLLQLGTI